MLLIYTHKIGPRFQYITKHIFVNLLGVQIKYTTEVADFVKHTGPKITYGKQPLQNEFFIQEAGLLSEQGINDVSIKVLDWEGTPCFFKNLDRSDVPFDLFSASFYLLSRYEEYLPHVKDDYGRFPAQDSLAFKQGFIHLPVVDIWAAKLLELLKNRFPELEYQDRKYKCSPIVDVTTSHKYANKGFLRGLGGLLLDIGSLQLKSVYVRLAVLFKIKKDPYNNFDELIEVQKKAAIKAVFFFQYATYSQFDKNISVNNNKFKSLIKSVADYSPVSLIISNSSIGNLELLNKEKKLLSAVIHRTVKYARLRYNRVEVPGTYRDLVTSEFTDDYSMGYTHVPGFRAGSCASFYFYDINQEVQQPIKIHPFAVHDYALLSCKNVPEMKRVLQSIYREIAAVKGRFYFVFSNELLGGARAEEWKEVYKFILQNYNE